MALLKTGDDYIFTDQYLYYSGKDYWDFFISVLVNGDIIPFLVDNGGINV